ncbi:hypothetical protein [Candidatus Leptofilum sp.]|uniref:hypothetical protein n=1 Tax=Candidatus Leptofilum sp. TaxID=3241576 RepID=UPI003B5A00D1
MNESQKPDPSRQTSSGQADPAPSTHTEGDYMVGDKVGGDKFEGDKITFNINYPAPNQPAADPETQESVRVYEHGRYNLASQFVGRKKELQELDDWQADASRPMFVIVALGGTGKSALTWHWLETVKARAEQPFKLIIWHGFYETGQVDTFLTDVLQFLGEKPQELGSKRVQLNRLLERLAAVPALIVLDGAERLLRAYSGMNAAYQGDEEQQVQRALECVDPVAGELLLGLSQLTNGSKTLMTTRLMPQELLGRGNRLPSRIGRRDLTGLDPDDAVRFFSEWGIQTTPAEVKVVCEPLEYHPFCMALLAGTAAHDFVAPNDLRRGQLRPHPRPAGPAAAYLAARLRASG